MHSYICSYQTTANGPGGIHTFAFDPEAGSLAPLPSVTDDIQRASFLAINQSGTLLALADERSAGLVHTYQRDAATGALTHISTQLTLGDSPCYVSWDLPEQNLLLTNYTSGSFVSLSIDSHGVLGEPDLYQHTGSGPNLDRQDGPHTHMVAPHPIDGQIYVSDLGIDEVDIYDRDPATGKLIAASPTGAVDLVPGTGPRHFAFAASGQRLYVIGELASTVSYFTRTAAGMWEQQQVISTLPASFTAENTTAQILLSPDGRFLYGSNRGHDSIATFAINGRDGTLTPLGHIPTEGRTPRNFAIDPTGTWLLAANQNSDSVITFRRDLQSGALTRHGEPLLIAKPLCIAFH
ncbi:MAG TPA: lactonase family protein [Thermomicrobiales bacterium]|nr:lactonase family protein [Thermomicrobiales bacterium]